MSVTTTKTFDKHQIVDIQYKIDTKSV